MLARLLSILVLLAILAQAAAQDLAESAMRLREQGVELIYSTDLVDPSLPVSEATDAATLGQALEEALAKAGLRLERLRPELWLIIEAPAASRPRPGAVLTGHVRDAITGRPIAGALVRVRGREAHSDARGLYLLTGLDPGAITLRVRAPGYEVATQPGPELEAGGAVVETLRLRPLPAAMDRLVVSASYYNLQLSEIAPRLQLAAADLITQPALGDDPLRAVNRLPGIASSGLSARSRVRGGGPSETLFLLDGQPLVDPFHLKGFQGLFSVINAAVLDSIDYYAGAFPVEYGNHLSGVINLNSRRSGPRHELGLGLYELYGLTSGSAGDTDWLLSYRRSALDLSLGLLENDFGSPEFSDSYLRLTHHLSPQTSLRFAWLITRDELSLNSARGDERAVAESRDGYYWLGLDQELDNGGQWSLTAASLSFAGTRAGRRLIPGALRGALLDDREVEGWGLTSQLQLPLGDRWELRAGGQLRRLDGEYDYRAESEVTGPLGRLAGTLGPADFRLQRQVSGSGLGLWGAVRWRPTDRLTTDLGLRWDEFTYLDVDDDDSLSVRLNALYHLGDGALRAAWGQFRQAPGIESLAVEQGESSFRKVQRAEHTVLGWDQPLGERLSLRVEAYDKRITDPWPRVDALFDPVSLLPELQPDRVRVEAESARSRGLELTLRGRSGGVDWWTSFTRARVTDRVRRENVPRPWDQAYAAGAGAEWDWGAWRWALAANYHDGWPTTALERSPVGELIPGERNGQRHDDFLSLDGRVSRSWHLGGSELRFYVELTNALNQANDCCVEYSLDTDGALQRDLDQWLPLVPGLGLVWSFD